MQGWPYLQYPSETCNYKKSQYIFSSKLRADLMPTFPREGQLMCTLSLSMCQ